MSLSTARRHLQALRQLVALLVRYRELIWELTKREISERYAGQMLGAIWAIGHPILLMALYVFVFAYVFPTRQAMAGEMARSYVVYILAGMIPWITFAESMNKSTGVIVGNSSLVKQVAFPLEILPVKGVLSSFVTQLAASTILIGYSLWVDDGGLPATVALIPILFSMQLLAMIGVAYLLASVTVFIRDVREITQVFTAAGLFMAPILFLPDWIDRAWPPLSFVLHVNPFSHLVWCYQDALFFGTILHPVSWAVTAILSFATFYVGYRVFRKLKLMFGEAL